MRPLCRHRLLPSQTGLAAVVASPYLHHEASGACRARAAVLEDAWRAEREDNAAELKAAHGKVRVDPSQCVCLFVC